MKTYLTLIYPLLISIVVIGCGEEEPIGQTPTESYPPEPISNVTSKSIPGGANISYTPPTNTDFSHVEAVYKVNDQLSRVAKSSKFTQSITVDGFPNTNPQKVTLYAVDYNGNKSTPVETEIMPLTPPYINVFESLRVRADFAGIFLEWENELNKFMGFTVLKYDEFGDFIPYEVIYDDFTTFNANSRGLEPIETELGVFVRDEYGNVSDTLVGLYTPLFEIELDKSDWKVANLDTDVPFSTRNSGVSYEKGFDGITFQRFNTGYVSQQNASSSYKLYLPHHLTYDLGETNLLSRFIYTPIDNWSYKQGGIKVLEVWGTNDQSLIDREFNGAYVWPDGDDPNVTNNWREEGMDGWTLLGTFETTKPSGLPGTQVAAGDNEFGELGFEFNFPPNTPPVRWVRWRSKEVWDNTLYSAWAEMTLFGAPTD
ncbi:DUF5000 domain-containing lipoprotein [Seonamhaeicola sp.]|uniref:DUF5000 domain-containing lipoprotein n=1 Tax=Seonamhaeicola sp. TaxID=1912245 RepID=UPI0026318050|nr:DUF5000 domain-containing lipoprotein [Seonamhaeicola sp.]